MTREAKMQNATLDERKSVDEYIKSISTTVVDSLEPCEDAISRKDAILQIQKHQICSCDPEECYPEQCERNVISWLNNLPPVTPTRRKGKWIVDDSGNYNGKWSTCYCSNCKDYYTRAWKEMKYCPNCGAEMETEE